MVEQTQEFHMILPKVRSKQVFIEDNLLMIVTSVTTFQHH